MSRARRPTALPPTLGAWLALALPACGGAVEGSPDPIAWSTAPLVAEELPPSVPLPGDALVLEPPVLDPVPEAPMTPVPSIDIVVRHGETLVVLADQAACTAEDIAALNGFDVRHDLRAGERILVPVDRVDGDTLLARRDAGLALRLDRYLRGRGGLAGMSTHRVRTGETGWGIARDVAQVPMWVLAAYNPEVDLDHLRIGDSLQVPVPADLVADAELSPG